MGFLSRFLSATLIGSVRAYQIVLSPLFRGCCRFEPSCSTYMIEAVRTHGAVKGFLLGVSRLSRCRPFGPSGYDPVPPMGKWKNDFNLKESKNEQD